MTSITNKNAIIAHNTNTNDARMPRRCDFSARLSCDTPCSTADDVSCS